ncbi:MAG: hypothetical protein IT457_14860 [Planctomycetes bacterium]|nr:hypothetical protein [Planctomycetota bacterium]
MPSRLFALLRGSRADAWHGFVRVGVNAAARVGLGVGIARSASTESFAIWVALGTVEVLAATVLSSGWLTALASIAPRLSRAEGDALLAAGARRGLLWSALTTALLMALAPVAAILGVDPLVALASAASTGAWLSSTVCATLLVASFRSATAAQAQALAYLPAFLALGICAAQGSDPLLAVFLASAGGQLGAALWMDRALPAVPRDAVSAERLHEVAVAGRVALFGSLANSVCTRVQPFVLAALGGPLAVGLYGAANTLAGPLRVFAGAVGDVLRPRLAKHQGPHGDAATARRLLALAALSIAGGGAVLLGACTWYGDAIGTAIFGERFRGLGRVLPAAASFVLLAALVHVLVVALQTRSLAGTRLATTARTWAAAVALLLVGPACAVDGARGAFWSMAAGEAVFLVPVLRALARLDATRLATVRP